MEYIWFGQKFAAPGSNISGITGASAGDSSWLDARNSWNVAANWRIIESGQTGGWTSGGSGDGYTGSNSYAVASNPPGAGDTVWFKRVHSYESGASGQNWPQSECLYGGWSGANGWYNAASGKTSGNLGSIIVEPQYFTTWQNNNINYIPFLALRFGEWVGPQATGVARGFRNGGLNLKTGYLSIDSRHFQDALRFDSSVENGEYWEVNNENVTARNRRIKILGSDTIVTTSFIAEGCGKYNIRCNYMENVTVRGTITNAWGDPDHAVGTIVNHGRGDGAMDFTYTGHIKSYCAVDGPNMDRFEYLSRWGGITAVPEMHIAPRYLTNKAGVVQIRGPVTSLNFYPIAPFVEVKDSEFEYWRPTTQGAKYHITSLGNSNNGTRGTFGTIKLHSNNPFTDIGITAAGGDEQDLNNYVSFNNGVTAGATDTITDLEVEGGVFRSGGSGGYGLKGTLNILDGIVQGDAFVNLEEKHTDATIEIAGYSGGLAGEGLFVASPNATIILPSGGNVAYNTPTAGITSAIQLGRAASKG